MQKLKLLGLCLGITHSMCCQLFINEVDVDTPGTDKAEIIEIRSEEPNFSTDGFIVVLFNGSTSGNDASYYTISLEGLTTDANHILLIGSNQLTPAPDIVLPDNTVQNGTDAVAIYNATFQDFPIGTKATVANLVDALVYDTSDPDDPVLMELLGKEEQINENENNNKDEESIQRKNDGTYEVKAPTPGMPNDGSGVVFTTISFSTEKYRYEEGEAVQIAFSMDRTLTEDFSFDIDITNDTFTSDDYTGDLDITIPAGMSTAQTTVFITDDTEDEGDEVLLIRFGMLPENFKRATDFIEVPVLDNDYQVMEWGTPLEPTFDIVKSDTPDMYYQPLIGTSDEALKQAIEEIIANPNTVRSHTYDDVIALVMEADQHPLNSNQVWLLYSEEPRSKIDFQWTNEQTGKWNREHIYPRSRGGYFSIEADKIVDGIEVFTTTNVDSLRHGNSDAHAIRPVDAKENGSRGNKNFGEYVGPENTLGSWRGDVARSVFYMTLRYKGLTVEDGFPEAEKDGRIGDLATLLDWHRNDPPDDFEMNRNNVIYKWQKNRNPFIDEPDLVEYIWGDKKGETWNNPLSVDEQNKDTMVMFPNPVKDFIQIKTKDVVRVSIVDLLGAQVVSAIVHGEIKLPLSLNAGVYFVKISSNTKVITKKIISK